MVRLVSESSSFDNLRQETKGGRGSVKAKHLVMALRDHFTVDLVSAKIAQYQGKSKDYQVDPNRSEEAKQVAPDVLKDQWALEYMTVVRVQPLIEALDDDVSSFVTIAEVNKFTSSRPEDWRYAHTQSIQRAEHRD